MDGLRVAGEIVAFQVELQVACTQRLEHHLALAARKRAQVRQQFGRRERFGHVVVGPGIEPGDLVGHGVARGEQQHGGAHALAAQGARHGEAVHLRQHDVQDDDVVPAVFAIGKPGQAVVHHVGVVAVLLQYVAERLGEAHVVFHDEDLHGVACLLPFAATWFATSFCDLVPIVAATLKSA